MTSSIFHAIGGWAGVATAVVGALVGLLLTSLWGHLSRRVPAWRTGLRANVDVARGRAPAIDRRRPVPGEILPAYFRQQGNHVDLAIYELSLRPDVPLMDLLYIEYLRGRLANGTIDNVVVVPWSGWRDESNTEGENRIRKHLGAIFGPYFPRVMVVTAAMLQEHADSVFENQFFEEVGSLGNSQFLRNASAVMGYRFRSYHDINQGHPETHQARSIVEHTVRGWLISKFVETEILCEPNAPRVIGSLMWERELTKLLLLRNLQDWHEDVECLLMLGRSVEFRSGLSRRPIPTFAGGAITAFGEPGAQRELIARKSKAELRQTNRLLFDILSTRTGLRDLSAWGDSSEQRDGSPLRGEARAVADSLRRVRALYGVHT